MLAALGYRFLDRAGNTVAPLAENLDRIHCIDSSSRRNLDGIQITVAGDVTSPLLGSTGAAAVFGPQKGATRSPSRATGRWAGEPRCGACALGFRVCRDLRPRFRLGGRWRPRLRCHALGATTASGAEYFLDLLSFDQHVADADLVITGEGRLDHQTLQGKLPAAVALRAAPTPVIAVVGRNDLDESDTASTQFADVLSVAEFAEADTSGDPRRTAELLQHIGTRIGNSFSTNAGN